MNMSKQQGVAAVEFTIMLPILLLLILTTAELGRAIYQYSNLTRMVRDAGRHLSNSAGDSLSGLDGSFLGGCGDDSDCNASCNNCVAEAKALLVYGKVGGSTPLLAGLSPSDIDVSGDPATDIVTISVTYDWQPMFGERIGGLGFGEGIDLGFPFVVSYSVRTGL
ncbi:TadE/TadG family type IV pilus assembly protein [Shewanella atlantica]|uniref:Pilus assembly protein n=1 Tax=Shewanella atlantica TaxID=271099 RepID=A0A3S0LEB0_9GAMM|nr:TadE/TadG family type IV pilus assembly protein [Shewanella atlantica]RTR33366.1 pilus assembly protein [Shewanella atlantica]